MRQSSGAWSRSITSVITVSRSGIALAAVSAMDTSNKKAAELGPRGPEGVPVDAPDNDGPAISPHAVSRMHRAEDDGEAFAQSPEYTDTPHVAHDDRHGQEAWQRGAPGSGRRDEANRGLDDANASPRREPNPSHHTGKRDTDPSRGLGEGELMEQPTSTSEARQPGADTPKFDE